ncbi:MAG: hypothetical protein V5A88_02835 [Candidatus Thermoplasmatota archaeon]
MVKVIENLTGQSSTSNFFYLLIGLLALLSILFVMGGDEGLPFILGRIMGFIIIVLLAYSLLEWITKIIEETDQWTDMRGLDKEINLRIEDISELLERASEGKKKSQEILHEKLKKIYFLKLKEKEDMSNEDLRDLVKEPEEFRDVVKDDVIADFILSMEEESGETSGETLKFLSSSKRRTQNEYRNEIKEIIQRIDQWEERYYG